MYNLGDLQHWQVLSCMDLSLLHSLLLCVLQGAEIISQLSRVEAEDEASSDDDKSLAPADSASDSDNVS